MQIGDCTAVAEVVCITVATRLLNDSHHKHLQLVLLHKGPLLSVLDLPHHCLAGRCNLGCPLLLLSDPLCDALPLVLILKRLHGDVTTSGVLSCGGRSAAPRQWWRIVPIEPLRGGEVSESQLSTMQIMALSDGQMAKI